MSTPHATPAELGHAGQHEPPTHVDPAAHIVPVPQSRHTVPPLITSGTGMPHATVAAEGHAPQHTRSSALVVPGGFTHASGAVQRDPKPVHVRHAGEGIGSPQSTAPAEGHVAQHMPVAPPVHVEPAPQPAVP
jgi:hypothetical protein